MSGRTINLTEEQMVEMWQMWRSGAFFKKDIAKHFGVCEKTVDKVVNAVQGWYNYGTK